MQSGQQNLVTTSVLIHYGESTRAHTVGFTHSLGIGVMIISIEACISIYIPHSAL